MGKAEHDREVGRIVSKLTHLNRLSTATASGASMSVAQRVHLGRQGVQRGVPDVLSWGRLGRYLGLAVEVKTGQGRLTPEQRRWLEWLAAEGWLAVVVGSLEELEAVLEEVEN
jgi:hypothetical protein